MAKGMGNLNKLMKQAQEMQTKMARIQEDLENHMVEASSGGGTVTVTMNGKMVMQSIKIKPEAVDPEDVDMLEDLIMAAVGEAHRKAGELAQEQMSKATGGMNLPGMF
ncbi:MAG: YbaB/EbfC family nucleoid-associated protein [Candidatus Eisenbacteria bacterium]|uniref:Nucleoid-associated protein HKN21_03085 n=1 Tax=Eiseniibacteriota bacterium TaxID=2212470 RepID=A0A7Y2H1J7_UNCEI|nr:YbaB/EbfC family nucleoid-associated protein [Candidatus Eisenbacteria bacterium]